MTVSRKNFLFGVFFVLWTVLVLLVARDGYRAGFQDGYAKGLFDAKGLQDAKGSIDAKSSKK